MKTVIISGGSGAVELQQALYDKTGETGTNLINLYDDGLSTGAVRKVCNVAGPSDMRKNHLVKFNILYNNKDINKIYSLRINRNIVKTFKNDMKKVLKKINNKKFYDLCAEGFEAYFSCKKWNKIKYIDFAYMNLIYAGLFEKYGPTKTDELVSDALKLDGNVVPINNDNVKLSAITKKGKKLKNEASIVNFKKDKSKDFIVDVMTGQEEFLSPKAVDTLLDAEVVIISTGTPWSSIIPTLKIPAVNKILSEKNYVYLIINAKDDTDTIGYTNKDYCKLYKKYIPSNVKILNEKNDFFIDKDNNNKIDHNLTVDFIMKDVINSKEYILSDLDGTLVYKNKNFANEFISFKKTHIVTGNHKKHCLKYINNMNKVFYDSAQRKGIKLNTKSIFKLSTEEDNLISKLKGEYYTYLGSTYLVRFKPIKNRDKFIEENSSKFNKHLKLVKRGKTTVELVKKNISKLSWIRYKFKKDSVLFLGNEPEGNDKELFEHYAGITVNNEKLISNLLNLLER